MEIKIEKGIEIPITKSGKWVNNLRKMEVGDSFFLEGFSSAQVNSIRTCARRLKGRFMFRKVEGGYRCWRFE